MCVCVCVGGGGVRKGYMAQSIAGSTAKPVAYNSSKLHLFV